MCNSLRQAKVIVVYILCLNLGKWCRGESKEGDLCIHKNGTTGNCVTLNNCDHALELIDNGTSPIYCNSGSEGNFNALVCCNTLLGLEEESQRISLQKCQKYYPEIFGPDWPDWLKIHVVSGKRALPKEYPHMALIGSGDKYNIKWTCGGSLISEKFVLTAAHCIETNAGPPRWVRLGELDTATSTDDADPRDFEVVRTVTHPGYEPSSNYHDIGLLELDSEVAFTEYMKPVCLYQSNDVSSGTLATATGWGTTSFEGQVSSHLMEVGLVLVNNTRCNDFYKSTSRSQLAEGIVENFQICAGGNDGKDTCQGDSGGPLLIRKPESSKHKNWNRNVYDIIGITSFGAGCGLADIPGVYTRVSYYLDWIESVIWSKE